MMLIVHSPAFAHPNHPRTKIDLGTLTFKEKDLCDDTARVLKDFHGSNSLGRDAKFLMGECKSTDNGYRLSGITLDTQVKDYDHMNLSETKFNFDETHYSSRERCEEVSQFLASLSDTVNNVVVFKPGSCQETRNRPDKVYFSSTSIIVRNQEQKQ